VTIGEFAEAAAALRRVYVASETSGGRTDAHEIAIGGFAGGPHTWDRGRDWVYEHGPNRAGSEDHPRSPHSCPSCSTHDLKLIHERDPDHVQPADFPAGPTEQYAGIVKDWA
jgi:hypothetical protein